MKRMAVSINPEDDSAVGYWSERQCRINPSFPPESCLWGRNIQEVQHSGLKSWRGSWGWKEEKQRPHSPRRADHHFWQRVLQKHAEDKGQVRWSWTTQAASLGLLDLSKRGKLSCWLIHSLETRGDLERQPAQESHRGSQRDCCNVAGSLQGRSPSLQGISEER